MLVSRLNSLLVQYHMVASNFLLHHGTANDSEEKIARGCCFQGSEVVNGGPALSKVMIMHSHRGDQHA